MTVGELVKKLGVHLDDTPVMLQDLRDQLLMVHPCLGEADEGGIVVIMARNAPAAPTGSKTP